MEDTSQCWIVSYSGEDRYVTGHRASDYKEASKFATMLTRNGYTVHALWREEVQDTIDWEQFRKKLFLRVDEPKKA